MQVDNRAGRHYQSFNMKDNIVIVLVSPQGDANVGAVARAMKNFGIHDLRLLAPACYLTEQAFTWAVNAADILKNAKTFKNLDDALADVTYSAAFTRRIGRRRKRQMLLDEAAGFLADNSRTNRTALVFGHEVSGLSNADIRHCDCIVSVPTSDEYPSLNLSQAVVLACYEIFCAKLKTKTADERFEEKFLPRKEVKPLIKNIEKMLLRLDYKDSKNNPLLSKIIARFEKIFGRSGLTKSDIRMFEGLIARIK